MKKPHKLAEVAETIDLSPEITALTEQGRVSLLNTLTLLQDHERGVLNLSPEEALQLESVYASLISGEWAEGDAFYFRIISKERCTELIKIQERRLFKALELHGFSLKSPRVGGYFSAMERNGIEITAFELAGRLRVDLHLPIRPDIIRGLDDKDRKLALKQLPRRKGFHAPSGGGIPSYGVKSLHLDRNGVNFDKTLAQLLKNIEDADQFTSEHPQLFYLDNTSNVGS